MTSSSVSLDQMIANINRLRAEMTPDPSLLLCPPGSLCDLQVDKAGPTGDFTGITVVESPYLSPGSFFALARPPRFDFSSPVICREHLVDETRMRIHASLYSSPLVIEPRMLILATADGPSSSDPWRGHRRRRGVSIQQAGKMLPLRAQRMLVQFLWNKNEPMLAADLAGCHPRFIDYRHLRKLCLSINREWRKNPQFSGMHIRITGSPRTVEIIGRRPVRYRCVAKLKPKTPQ